MDEPETEHRLRASRYIAIGIIWMRLAMTDIGLRVFPGVYSQRLKFQSDHNQLEMKQLAIPPSIQRIITNVRLAAGHPLLFNMSCLRRSLVLQSLLRKQGVSTSIIFGVHKGNVATVGISGEFKAHAWLVVRSPGEYAGMQLDPSSVYDSFERLSYHG